MNFQVNVADKPHACITSPTKNPTKMTVNLSFLKDRKKNITAETRADKTFNWLLDDGKQREVTGDLFPK